MFQHSRLGLAVLLLISCPSVYGQQNTTPPPARKATVRPVAAPEEVKSQWEPGWGTWGLTTDLYKANHLSRLATDDISNVVIAAWVKGYSDGENSISPTCGPTSKNPDRSMVKLFLDMPGDTDDEVASGLRSRLRAFPDVRLVFTQGEADAVIGILVLKNKLKNSSETLGYTLSYYASRPCAVGTGTGAYNFDLVLSTDLQTAASVGDLVEAVASTIDSHVSENVRKWNANFAKTEKKTP